MPDVKFETRFREELEFLYDAEGKSSTPSRK